MKATSYLIAFDLETKALPKRIADAPATMRPYAVTPSVFAVRTTRPLRALAKEIEALADGAIPFCVFDLAGLFLKSA